MAPFLAAAVDLPPGAEVQWTLVGMTEVASPWTERFEPQLASRFTQLRGQFDDARILAVLGWSSNLRNGLVADVEFRGKGRPPVRQPIAFDPAYELDDVTHVELPAAEADATEGEVRFVIRGPDGNEVDGVQLMLRPVDRQPQRLERITSSGESITLAEGEYSLRPLPPQSFLPHEFPEHLVVRRGTKSEWVHELERPVTEVEIKVLLPDGQSPTYAMVWIRYGEFATVVRSSRPERINHFVEPGEIEIEAKVGGYENVKRTVRVAAGEEQPVIEIRMQ